MTELELSAHLEFYFRTQELGGNTSRQIGVDFGYGIASSGLNSLTSSRFDGICSGLGLNPAFPFGGNRSAIQKGDPVVLDYGVTYFGYHIDQTRMFSYGKPHPKALDAYQAMVEIEEAVIAGMKPGKPWKACYEEALELAKKLGYEENFMGTGLDQVRFVGHGVGLELDEPPYIAAKMDSLLETGMTIAIEPKVALPGIGVVGIEDTVLMTETGTEMMTKAEREFSVY